MRRIYSFKSIFKQIPKKFRMRLLVDLSADVGMIIDEVRAAEIMKRQKKYQNENVCKINAFEKK